MNKNMNFAYFGTSDPMAEREIYRLEKYLKQHKKKFVYTEQFIIDIKALQRPFLLDCFNCKQVHQGTCCEDGQPYAVHYSQIKPMEEYAFAMEPGFMLPEAEASMREKGIWQLGRYDTIRTFKKNCLFLTERNGFTCCSIHAHAEAHGHDVFPVKPFSCMLYPLDIIQLPSRILITALTEETASFNRWGIDYLEQFYCASLERRQANDQLPPDLFPVDCYQPAYVWGKELLGRTFGHELIDVIEQHIH